ncbi:MAG: FG-GAP repeat domain-containing protein [Pseudomonadota bacterium]
MQNPRWVALLFTTGIFSISACGGGGGGGDNGNPPPPPVEAWFNDVTSTHVDQSVIGKSCMDVQAFDYDTDNDLDLILAIEFGQNVLLQNDGNGRFAAVSSVAGMLANREDHEDIALADFDGDTDLDIAVAAEDTTVHEIYLNSRSEIPITLN